MMKKTKGHSDGMKVQGFFRVQLTEEGKGVIGDSGWNKNQVTDLGIQQYILNWLYTGSGAKFIKYMALGAGTAPASSDTSLQSEVTGTGVSRAAVTPTTTSNTAQFTAAFNSANSFVTTTVHIANIGLFDTNSGGTIFAGNTFASSSCATNQSVNATYQIRFASA